MQPLLADLSQWCWAVLTQWQGWVTGGVIPAGYVTYEKLSGRTVSVRHWISVFLVLGFVAANFQAWRDEHRVASHTVATTEVRTQLGRLALEGELLLARTNSAPNPGPADEEVRDWYTRTVDYLLTTLGPDYAQRFVSDAGLLAKIPSSAPDARAVKNWQMLDARLTRLNEILRDLSTR